ncbi:MAG TPA: transglutaminase-like domain-containing protein [Acidobacteriota bacterium]|jgi:transglutaminase-like putative cysteine protease
MSKPGLLAIPFVAAAAFALAGSNAPLKTRAFELTYRAVITEIPPNTKRLEVWIPYPQSDANQEITNVRVDSPSRTTVGTESMFGNKILHTSIERPAAPLEITLRFITLRRENVRRDPGGPAAPDSQVRQFLKPERLVPETQQVRQWALQVVGEKKTDVEKARAIYDYAVSNVKYDKSGTGWGRGDLLYVCDQRRGNCTDFHALITGFGRAVGIPARFSIGLPLPEKRGEGEIAGYHCWAELYVKGYGWVPVDASEAFKHPEKRDYFFGAHDENRVQLSVGRDLVLKPRQKGEPLNYFIYPYVEADGKAVSGVKATFAYRDLNEAVSAPAGRER